MTALETMRKHAEAVDGLAGQELPLVERAILELAEDVEGIGTIIGRVDERKEGEPLGLASRIKALEAKTDADWPGASSRLGNLESTYTGALRRLEALERRVTHEADSGIPPSVVDGIEKRLKKLEEWEAAEPETPDQVAEPGVEDRLDAQLKRILELEKGRDLMGGLRISARITGLDERTKVLEQSDREIRLKVAGLKGRVACISDEMSRKANLGLVQEIELIVKRLQAEDDSVVPRLERIEGDVKRYGLTRSEEVSRATHDAPDEDAGDAPDLASRVSDIGGRLSTIEKSLNARPESLRERVMDHDRETNDLSKRVTEVEELLVRVGIKPVAEGPGWPDQPLKGEAARDDAGVVRTLDRSVLELRRRIDELETKTRSIIGRIGDRLDRRFERLERRAQRLEVATAAAEDADETRTIGERVTALEQHRGPLDTPARRLVELQRRVQALEAGIPGRARP